jgi:4-diphosphocytidyl-2-C-methyl-D-erythritol kinase
VIAYRALAPAKVNLGLFVGPVREQDGRHELVTVMQAISLSDVLTLEPAGGGAERDELSCAGVPGGPEQNLAWRALQAFRSATGWNAAPLRVRIQKRIPVAAGLGGGSADAGATLRLARRASGLGDEALLRELAAGLGADVPAQVSPGRWLASGVGERLLWLPAPAGALALLVLALPAQLSTAAVYAQAERQGSPRSLGELRERAEALASALGDGAPLPARGELLRNDLQPAASALCPPVRRALELVDAAGAQHTLLSGSGPTVLGLYAGPQGATLARRAARELAGERPPPSCAHAVDASFARVASLAA